MSKKESKEEDKNLSTFLPTNLISDLDESFNLSSKNDRKESILNYFLLFHLITHRIQ